MELFASRQEIRRRVLSRLGYTTNDAQAPQVQDQLNEFIRSAAEAVYERCPWARSQRETFVDIGIDQRFVNYPDQAGPGNIISIGVWVEEEQAYRQLRRGRIPVQLDDEPLVAEGEPASIAGRLTPELYELKNQIELWRRPDKVYELKIDHTIHPNLAADATVSVVDAECIILWAMADKYDHDGDGNLAQIARGKFNERIAFLVRDQHPLVQVKRGRFNRLSVSNRQRANDYIPDSGAWPSQMPS